MARNARENARRYQAEPVASTALADQANPAQDLKLSPYRHRLAHALLEYVDTHFREPINLSDLASVFRVDPAYVSTLFHRAHGVTFHEYLEKLRMSYARNLLTDPRNRIAEVAQASGYASTDAFRHAFKAREKLSPKAWRARY